MANHVSHASLPYPVKHARYTIPVPYLDADGDPTDPTTPDTEFSLDNSGFADCAEEVTTITGGNGCGFITITGAETNGSLLIVVAKVGSGPKNTILVDKPRVLPIEETGTAQAGAAGTITLAAGAAAFDLVGCIVRTTGGTGGGGTGGANNQARVITAYNTSTKVATIEPNWETNPSSDTTYDILLTELAVNSTVTRALRPATDGSTLTVTAGVASADAKAVDGSTAAATALKNMSLTLVSGTVVANGGNTATTFKTDLTETQTNYYGDSNGGNVLVFITGTNNATQARRISAYDGSTKFVTVEAAFDAAPTTSDTFVLLGRIEI